MEERIKIINSFKSSIGERKNGIGKRLKFLAYFNILNIILNLIVWGIILFSITKDLININVDFYNWNKMGLIVILSLSFLLKTPIALYEIKLLKHLKKLKSHSNTEIDKDLNSALKNIISPFGKKFVRKFILWLAFIILFLGIWQLGFDSQSPLWNFTKIPLLLILVINIFEYYKTNKNLSLNIQKVEEIL